MVMGSLREDTEVAIIGAGPGGYVAALRLADLGKEVALIDEHERPGGTCLLEGCIPSKALINAVEVVESAKAAEKLGLRFSDVQLDLDTLRQWTQGVVQGLSQGIEGLLKKRDVEVIHGRARFESSKSLRIEGSETSGLTFRQCIIATGSHFSRLPAAGVESVWSSADALRLPSVPEKLLVVGGGYIGLELGLVYAGLGSHVTVAEFYPRLLLGADPDLVAIMTRQVEKRLEAIMVDSKVSRIEKREGGFQVAIEHEGKTDTHGFDQVLVAVGRKPNTSDLGLENTKVALDEGGYVQIDAQCRTADPNIFAIGDVVPGPMLAHKASREGKVAAEVIADHKAEFDNRAIPAVVFTDPEVAWTGLTEREAKEQGVDVRVGRFPLSALGRARTLGRSEGMVKILSDPKSGLVLGVGMVGPQASELIAEGTLALEMGATLEDLMVTIHPHPTLSEAIMEAAEVAAGVPIHITPRKRTDR
jgi:dihydrolipoamide dehydrogenase